MTVSSDNNRSTYNGNGVTTVFAYTFRILENNDLLVQWKNNTTGVITTKTINTHYTVTGAGDSAGGNVTFTGGNVPPSGTTVIILRNMDFLQETDYTEYDNFPAETHEAALDKLTMEVQQLSENLERAVLFDPAVADALSFDYTLPDPAAAANKSLIINATATGFDYVSSSTSLNFPGSNGLLAKVDSGNISARSVTGTADEISVSNGDGVAGNPTISLPSALTFTGKTVTGGTFATPVLSGTITGTYTLGGTPSMAATALTGNLAIARFNSGTSASSSTYWRGDGTWVTPPGGRSEASNGSLVDANGSDLVSFTATSSAVYSVKITNGSVASPYCIISTSGAGNLVLSAASSVYIQNAAATKRVALLLTNVTTTTRSLSFADGATVLVAGTMLADGGALGTPSSATLTNGTGLPISTGVSGLGTGVAAFLATPSSANLRSALTDGTGTGAAVFATSPTLVTPALGIPSSCILTNCSGLVASTGITATGTPSSSTYLRGDNTWATPSGTGGKPIVQQVYTQTGAVATGTTILVYDDTIPQQTEGDQYMTLSITPSNASNILVIDCKVHLCSTVAAVLSAALFQDSTASALKASCTYQTTATTTQEVHLRHIMVAGTTSAIAFKIRGGGHVAGTTTFNGGAGSARIFGGVICSYMHITEITV